LIASQLAEGLQGEGAISAMGFTLNTHMTMKVSGHWWFSVPTIVKLILLRALPKS
jgi:hypothetical protein